MLARVYDARSQALNADKRKTVNGSAETPAGAENWPGIGKAAATLNVAHSFITKMANAGHLRTTLVNGTRRYDPEGLEQLREYVDIAEEPKPGISSEEFRAGTELVKAVLSWHEKMFQQFALATSQILQRSDELSKTAREQTSLDRARIEKLEGDRDAASAAREKSLTEEQERRLMVSSFEANERRKDKAFSIFSDRLIPVILKRTGLDADPRVATALKLVGSMTRDQMIMLVAIPGVVTDAQREQIMALLGELSAEEKEKLGIAQTEAPNPEKG